MPNSALQEATPTLESRAPFAAAPLLGEVCAQFIRCGKAGCRCNAGKLHGPYHYRIWREGLRVHKVYIKAAELEAVQAGCRAHHAFCDSLRLLRGQRADLTSRLARTHRHTRRLLNHP